MAAETSDLRRNTLSKDLSNDLKVFGLRVGDLVFLNLRGIMVED